MNNKLLLTVYYLVVIN